MKKSLSFVVVFLLTLSVSAQTLSVQVLNDLRASYNETPEQRALRNAAGGNDLRKLALNQDNLTAFDTEFTLRVPNKGITDQKQSGRCWMFTGLNVLRSTAIREHNLDKLEFSEAYLFFYDQLEKANLFLQSVIDTRKLPMDDKKVEFLFKNPIGDGGTFTGVADLVNKYGLVPAEVMPETFTTNSTSRFRSLLSLKLREQGLQLRESKAAEQQLVQQKEEMLRTIYRMLVTAMGIPPQQFTWKGEQYTPLSFADKYVNRELVTDYVMLMNDPTREYYKVYEIDLDRHIYEGQNWLYVNLPVEDIQQMAIASLRDSVAMYFSCDVAKELNSDRGLLDLRNYDYGAIFGTTFPMDKKQRIQTFASGSSHAMTLVAVNLQDTVNYTQPDRWMVENSWGEKSGWKGHLIMTDEWFREYMFRLVVARKYVPQNILDILKQKPVRLPVWDPMFLPEQ
ncbi:MAG: C1 family peptidase [Paludibacteraceae bacterium]|nr:C1 family peptidase [Paludibacteraceae bacterium]